MLVASFVINGHMTAACVQAPQPLDLRSQDPRHDQRQIAAHYCREAVIFRQKAAEMTGQLVAYERLFGRDSEWAAGARLLAQFYEEAAHERGRQAAQHSDQSGDCSPASRSVRR